MILNLGVIDLPYVEQLGVTTGEVAQRLEDDYHVMETFADKHADFIGNSISNDIQHGIEDIMSGAPLAGVSLNGACQKIKVMFNYFIDNMEMNGKPGVPTKASLRGKNSRFKKGKQKGVRPSFKDTGLYESSFTAWVTE